MSVERAFLKIEDYREELAEVCSRLIQCPSAHPEGSTVECVEYIKDYFDTLGIYNEVYKKNDEKPNIVARIKGAGTKKIMWVGHLDVVPPGKTENWTFPPYSGKITEEGNIWGRGASDMKGACAAAIIAARVLSEFEKVPNSVDFWFTADEEIGGGDGALWLSKEGFLEGDVCIIGDGSSGTPTTPAIDLGCKGIVRPKIAAKGRTAHGSRPFLGDNALDKLLRVIKYVKRIDEFALDVPGELEHVIAATIDYMMKKEFTEEQNKALKKLFHYPSVSLNILNGGVKTNVIPDYAEAYFDIRITPGSNPIKVRRKVRELVEVAGEQDVTLDFLRLSKTAGYYEPPQSLFAKQLARTVEIATGKIPIFKILTGGTDAIRIKKYTDIPCLGFGSCIDGQAHVPDEHNNIELLTMSSKVYSAFPLTYID
jgi:succinyl-diaminopimelate desuccinylase